MENSPSKKGIIKKHIESHSNLRFEINEKFVFIKFIRQIAKKEISELLEELWVHKFKIAFHDIIYPKESDDGAYFFSRYEVKGKEKSVIIDKTIYCTHEKK